MEPDKPLAVKIDTQGAEPFIISGARRILSTAELLAVEFWPYGMARMGGDAQVVIDFLRTNFGKGLIGVSNRDDFGEWQAMDAIARQLEERANKDQNRAHIQCDVIVMK